MRCGRSVADPPDDPVVVEASREVAERVVELLDRAEAVQPEQLLLQGADESPSLETPGSRCPRAGGRRTGSTRCRGLELVQEGVRDELAAVLVAQPRPDPAVASPTKRFEASTERISASSSSSERKDFGPRFPGSKGSAPIMALKRWTVARASRHARQTRRMP